MPPARSSLRSIGLLSACSFAQMLLQLAFQILLARLFGAGADKDAYDAALQWPAVISTVVAGVLPSVVIPAIIHRREQLGPDAAHETASLAGLLIAVGLGALCLAGWAAADPLMSALRPRVEPVEAAKTAHLFRIVVWLAWTQSVTALLQAISHAEQQFVMPAVAPIAGTACALAWTWIAQSRYGIDAVAGGVLAGSFVNVFLQAPAFIRSWHLPAKWDDDMGRIFRLVWPLLLGALYCKLDPVCDVFLAELFDMPVGSIASLNYAARITGVLLTLSTAGLAVVVFPVLSQHAAGGREAELRDEVIRSFRFLIFSLSPIVMGLGLFHRPVLRDMMQRGNFTSHDTKVVGTLVAVSLGLLLAASAGEILTRVFYATRDTRTPLAIGIVGFTLGIGLKVGLGAGLGVYGLVLATSIYYVLNAAVMLRVLSGRLGSLVPPDTLAVLGRALFASTGASLVAFAILQIAIPFVSIPAAAGAAIVYIALSGWAGDEFARSLIRSVRTRFAPLPPAL